MCMFAESPKRLAIMGGTFDPIHIGHLVTAEAVRHEFNIDKVIFVPTGHPPHKSSMNMTISEHRYLMTVLATTANVSFEVSRIEIDREGVTYTVDTIKELKKIYGQDTELYFITGADAIHEILTWKKPEELLELCTFVAVTRPGYKKEQLKEQVELLIKQYNANIYFLEVPALAISSSDIRQRVEEKRPIKYLVTGTVENYIDKHGLYKKQIVLTQNCKEKMMDYVKNSISLRRYTHTKGVIEMALELAKIHDVDYDSAFTAALFHDLAKEFTSERKKEICEKYNIALDPFEEAHIDIAHGKIAACMLEREWGIYDEDILNSIRYHTVGREHMSNLEKIIYLADMVENGRKPFKGKEEILSLSMYDLDKAMHLALSSSKHYVENILSETMHPITDKLIEQYKN
ncbi:MAG: nicotinate-nucleotide adenylyltransferase [Cellulosilyticaceae bacterium]